MPTTFAPTPVVKKGRRKVYAAERRVLGVNLPVADIEEAKGILHDLGISFSAYLATLLAEDLKVRRVGRFPPRR
jgi:hypothetical protein